MTIEKSCKNCNNVYMVETEEEIDFLECYGISYTIQTQCPICQTLQNVYVYATDHENQQEE